MSRGVDVNDGTNRLHTVVRKGQMTATITEHGDLLDLSLEAGGRLTSAEGLAPVEAVKAGLQMMIVASYWMSHKTFNEALLQIMMGGSDRHGYLAAALIGKLEVSSKEDAGPGAEAPMNGMTMERLKTDLIANGLDPGCAQAALDLVVAMLKQERKSTLNAVSAQITRMALDT